MPTGITRGLRVKTVDTLVVKSELQGKYIKEAYKGIYDLVKEHNGSYNKSEFAKKI